MCFAKVLTTKSHNIPHDHLHSEVMVLPDIGPEISQDSCTYIEIEKICSLCPSQCDLMMIQLNIRVLIGKQSDISWLISDCSNSQKR